MFNIQIIQKTRSVYCRAIAEMAKMIQQKVNEVSASLETAEVAQVAAEADKQKASNT